VAKPAVQPGTPAHAQQAQAQQAQAQQAPAQQAHAQQPAGARPQVEVAFVLDTTGSMGGLLEGAKRKVWAIANQIARGQPAPLLKVALVGYRDVGDAYVTKRFDFTSDLDTAFSHLSGFTAEGGGDAPEHVGRALGEAVSKLGWSKDRQVMRLVFLVGDAPPAAREPEWNYRTWARAAAEHRIVVNTVRCGEDPATEEAWRTVARLTRGTFGTIDQAGGMVAVATPYDAELDRLNRELLARTRYAGAVEVRAANVARVQAMDALPAEAKAERTGYMKAAAGAAAAPSASSAPEAVGGAVDLTSAPERLESFADDALPEDLRALDKAARRRRVAELAGERRALEGQLAALTRQREAWRAKHVAVKADAFDAHVLRSVRAQAAGYGITY
jgi:hypothetical protein